MFRHLQKVVFWAVMNISWNWIWVAGCGSQHKVFLRLIRVKLFGSAVLLCNKKWTLDRGKDERLIFSFKHNLKLMQMTASAAVWLTSSCCYSSWGDSPQEQLMFFTAEVLHKFAGKHFYRLQLPLCFYALVSRQKSIEEQRQCLQHGAAAPAREPSPLHQRALKVAPRQDCLTLPSTQQTPQTLDSQVFVFALNRRHSKLRSRYANILSTVSALVYVASLYISALEASWGVHEGKLPKTLMGRRQDLV